MHRHGGRDMSRNRSITLAVQAPENTLEGIHGRNYQLHSHNNKATSNTCIRLSGAEGSAYNNNNDLAKLHLFS